MKKINSHLSTARDQLNLGLALEQRLQRRKGPDSLVCPICSIDEFVSLAESQSRYHWFERIRRGAGWESIDTSKTYRVDRRDLEQVILGHCSLLARTKIYSNFTELKHHVLNVHQVIFWNESPSCLC